MTPKELELEVLIHRYLYYVESSPVIPDSVYDKLEREARAVLPEDSVVNKVGSSNPWDYSEEVKALALKRLV